MLLFFVSTSTNNYELRRIGKSDKLIPTETILIFEKLNSV